MENKILEQINKAIAKAIIEELVGWDKPLSKLTSEVIEAHSEEIYNLIDKEIITLITNKGFKEELKKALNSKLAKILINRLGGELEKQVNILKANPATRAKITVAIDKLIKEL